MQLVRRTVGHRTTLKFMEKTFNYNVNPASGASSIQTYDIVMMEKLLLHCGARSSKVVGSANRVLEILRGKFTGKGCTEKATKRRGVSVSVNSSNAVARWFCLERDEVSIARPSQAVAKKPIRSGTVNTEFSCNWNADSRGGKHPFGVHWRGSVSSLHTEVKGEKPRDEKSEDVTTVRRIKSAVKEKASSKARGHNVRSEVSTPIPRESTANLKFPSIREEEQNYLPMSRRGLEFIAHKEGDEELATIEEYASAGLHHDDHEETQKRSLLRRGHVQQLLPSESRYDTQNLVGKETDEMRRRASAQAMALLRAALDEADEDDGKVEEEFQRSLRVGIVGAPNAGKSLLTNQLVGTRVSAVSRKTNTTHREHLGVFTKGDTQLLYYDTPGLHLDIEGSPLRVDAQHRVQNAWEIVDFCEALVVLVDAERQIRRPDKRVQRLVEKLGTEQMVSQKRVLCLNKVDLIEQKRLLLPLAKQFEYLLGYDRIFMISGLTGSGVKDVKDYLLDQAVLRPWDEDPELTNHRDIALEIVREQVFEHLHEELPHTTKQKLVSWKVLKDGSVRIQQLLLVAKKEHQKILVGKNGAVIGDIGIKARQELQQILGVTVHLVLDVKLMTGMMTGDE